MSPKWRTRLAWAALCVGFAASGTTAYWSLEPADGFAGTTSFEAVPSTVTPGDVVTLTNVFCDRGVADFTVEKSWRREGGFTEVVVETVRFRNIPPGCTDSTTRIEVPEALLPGVWHVVYRVTYPVNPIRDDVFENTSSPVTVLAP